MIPVNLEWDVTFGMLTHDCVLIPAGVECIGVSIEGPVTHRWEPGHALQQNKLTTTVKHQQQAIVLDGHDTGAAIPHVTIPANNALIPVHILASSKKPFLSASKVTMNGVATTAHPPWLPMMSCGDPVSAPLSFVLTNAKNSVTVGVTLSDVFWAAVGVAFSMGLDLIATGLSPGFKKIKGQLQTGLRTGLQGGAAAALKNAGLGAVMRQSMSASAKKAFEKLTPFRLDDPDGKKTAVALGKTTLSALGGFTIASLKGDDNPTGKATLFGHPAIGQVDLEVNSQPDMPVDASAWGWRTGSAEDGGEL